MEQNGTHAADAAADEGDARGTAVGPLPPRVARAPTGRDDWFYNMGHPKRGMALIFNHENFDVHNLKARTGTNVDCHGLEQCLRGLGFKVAVFRDLPYKAVLERVAAASAADHSDADCLVVVVLTHGELGRLYARDDHYKPELLWRNFTADRCPSLAGKPKLFFIQACQGEELDGGIFLTETTETDGPSSTAYKIPIHADFLIGYSTVPGYYSWRNTTRGSWFIQALIEELREHGEKLDLLALLTLVNRKVAYSFESNTPDSPVMHQQKQIPSINFMLTRSLVFTKKN